MSDANNVSELGDDVTLNNVIVSDGTKLTISLDGGDSTNGATTPEVFEFTVEGDGLKVGTYNNSDNSWTDAGNFTTFGGDDLEISEWFSIYGDELNNNITYSINDLSQDQRDNYENQYNPWKTEEDTKATSNTEETSKTNLETEGPKWTVTGINAPQPGTLIEEEAFSRHRILTYPTDHTSEEYDFIKIIPIEYVPALSTKEINRSRSPNEDIDASSDLFGLPSIENRYLNVKKVGSTVFLPMTPDISENNAVDWGRDSLNPIQAAGAGVAMGAFNDVTAGAGAGEILSNLMGNTSATAQAFMSAPGVSNFIKAYFAGRAVNANVLGRAGIAINPNLEVLFNGPALRTFNYSFKFTPRDQHEAKIVRTIIKVFKKSMAPKRRDKIFLNVPAVYKIQYIFNGDNRDHPFLNRIKPCALSTFNVQYAPDGSYMTYEDGSMTSYNVSMVFKEIEPIYNDDIRDVDYRTTGF